jgi:hypothetical protein
MFGMSVRKKLNGESVKYHTVGKAEKDCQKHFKKFGMSPRKNDKLPTI